MTIGKRTLYRYYLTGQAAYNHIGNPKKAYEYYELLNNLSENVPLELRLQARRQMVVSGLDTFRPDTIRQYAVETLRTYEAIQEIEKKHLHIPLTMFKNNTEYGMLLSQTGQVYAFLRKKEAADYFIAALNMFPKGKSDYYRTLTYLLHHYIDMKDFMAYSKWAPLLFNKKKSFVKQFEWILDQAGKDNPFTLDYIIFVYIKALYTFRFDEIEGFPDFAKEFDAHNIKRKEHPWELIDKYLALIELEKETINETEHTRSRTLINEMKDTLSQKAYTTEAIVQYGEIQYLQTLGESCEEISAAETAKKNCSDHGSENL